LVDCLDMNQQSNEIILPNQAKNLLKTEYEKLKLDILRKLAADQKPGKEGSKNWMAKFLEIFLKLLSRH
ncbi:MAG: serine/threonine protein kinase, partial [Nostoc sp.]